MKLFSTVFILIMLMSAVFTVSTSAHNYHTSLTRIDFNKKEKSLEIEINLFNHDLEIVLKAKNKKPVDFEKSKEMDKILLEYLNETFIIKDEKGSQKKLVWVGKEVNVDLTTAFVEIREIDGFEKLELQNKIFFESFAEQVNLVTLHSDNKKFDLAFKVGDGFKNIAAVDPN